MGKKISKPRKGDDRSGGSGTSGRQNVHEPLGESRLIITASTAEMLAVHEALDCLAAHDPQWADLVKLRYFVRMNMP